MTELKHGSNVAGLQTEAILDVRTDEWVVNVSTGAALSFFVLLAQQASWAGLVERGTRSSLRCVRTCNLCMPAALLLLPVQTPDDGAIKWWIGNAAEDGKAATVFARLKVSEATHPALGTRSIGQTALAAVFPRPSFCRQPAQTEQASGLF